MNHEAVFNLLGERGVSILAAIEVIRDTPDEVWTAAIADCDRRSAIGPMPAPSAWLGRDAVEGHRRYRDTFVACRSLTRAANRPILFTDPLTDPLETDR